MTAKDEIALLKRRIKARTEHATEAKVVAKLQRTVAMYEDFMRRYGPQHEGYARWQEGSALNRKRMASPVYIGLRIARAQRQNEADQITITMHKVDAE